MDQSICEGEAVLARTSTGEWLRKTAVTAVIPGRDFAVVWVRWPDDDDAIPFPAEDVVRDTGDVAEAISHDEYRARMRR